MANIQAAFTVKDGIEFDETNTGIFAGTVDPRAGAGEPAPIGSLFLRATGELFIKVGAADTAWELIPHQANITIDADLAAIANLTTTGYLVRTAADTWATRAILGAAGNISVTNGSGAGGDTVIDLASTGVAPGTYTKLTIDAYGRATAGTNPTTLADYGILDAQPLSTFLTAIAGATASGIMVKDGNALQLRSISAASGRISVTNGDGVLGNPTLDVVEGNLALNNLGGTLGVAKGGTNLTALGAANQVLGVNLGGTGLEYKTIAAGTNVNIVHSPGNITINAVGANPGGANTNVQFNNAGTFGGASAFSYIDSVNPRVEVRGTNLTTQLALGVNGPFSTAEVNGSNNATLFIENNGNVASEGLRVWFRRGAGDNSWITCNDDQKSAPNIKLIDESNNPSYVQFSTLGTGTFTSPQYTSIFGARGTYNSRTGGNNEGFAWYIGANQTDGDILITTPVMELDRQWLRVPSGATAARPTAPQEGMVRHNTDHGMLEVRGNNNWVQLSGVISRSAGMQAIVAAAGGNFIAVTIPGGTLGSNRLLRIRAGGTWSILSGVTRTVTMNIAYGGTTMFSDVSSPIASGQIIGWSVDLILAANGSPTAQTINGLIHLGGGPANIGITGDLSTDEINAVAVIAGTSAVNSAVNQPLNLSVSFNGGGINWITYFHLIELL